MKSNYYIIGSKYQEGKIWVSKFGDMFRKNVVSVGFAAEFDLSELVGHSEKEIEEYLKDKGEKSPSCYTLKLFLNLKEGDLIAIKSIGQPYRLEIIAYAVVKKINGKIYEWNRESLGHLIYVDFLEYGSNKKLEIGGYSKTIYKLNKADIIKDIFGVYYEPDFTTPITGRNDTEIKNTGPQIRNFSTNSYYVEYKHKELQKKFKEYLVEKYGEDKVKEEENYVDLKLTEHDRITFFEVKFYNSVSLCIRDALGQILEYLWKDKTKNKAKSKIVVIGPIQPTKDEEKYIEFLKKHLEIEFDYQCCDLNT